MIQLMPNRTDVAQKFPNVVYQAMMEAPRSATSIGVSCGADFRPRTESGRGIEWSRALRLESWITGS